MVSQSMMLFSQTLTEFIFDRRIFLQKFLTLVERIGYRFLVIDVEKCYFEVFLYR